MARTSRSLTRKSIQQGHTPGTRVFDEVRKQGAAVNSPADVRDLSALELDELRQLKHPPEVVRRVLELVYLLLTGKPPLASGVPWDKVLRTLSAPDFRQRLDEFDMGNLEQSPEVVRQLSEAYFGGPEPLTLRRVQKASLAAAALFGWSAHTLGVVDAVPIPHPFMPCPGGHKLHDFTTAHGNFRCNVCRTKFPKGEQGVVGCRVCDYDLCDRCVHGESFHVNLCPADGEQIGLELRKLNASWPKAIRIQRVDAGGTAIRWNTEMPDRQLREGDFVYSVNGEASDVTKMLDALNSGCACSTLVFRKAD